MDIIKKFVCCYLEETLLDLGLSGCVEVVGVRGTWVDVFDDGIHVDDVLLDERLLLFVVETVFSQKDLDAGLKQVSRYVRN